MTVTARTLRLGTRRAALALAQSGRGASGLRAHGHDVALVEIVTEGDRSTEALTQLGGTGVFVTELRRQLAEGTIDVAVHSLKDLPTADAPGLVVAAVPQREDPRDALVSRDSIPLNQLAAGEKVGTGSPRPPRCARTRSAPAPCWAGRWRRWRTSACPGGAAATTARRRPSAATRRT